MTTSPAVPVEKPLTARRIGAVAAAFLAATAVASAQVPPKAGATLSRTSVPAAGRQEAIVTVSAFGYYALTAASSQGTALQLIDRMAGPGPLAGAPGSQDGRLDLFLDRGEYKLVALGHEKATGNAKLEVHPFAERHAPQPPMLVELKAMDETLGDFQQASYWLQIEEARVVAIEAAGRNVADLRLWRDGSWLHEAVPERAEIEPKKGHPMTACRIEVKLEPGLYRVTAYGGPGRPWSEDASEHPLYVRYGIPRLPEAGRQRMTVGPLGYDRFLVPGEATYFRIELPEARPAQLQVGDADPDRPFRNAGPSGTIDKKSVPPAAEVELRKNPDHDRLVTVTAETGQPYILQQFEASREYRFDRTGGYWISTVHSGHAADSVDATVIVARWTTSGMDRAAFLDSVVQLDSSHGWVRRCNLLEPMEVFLKVGSKGRYEVQSRGVEATFRIEPFLTSRPQNYETPPLKPSGSTWDLDEGFYVLAVNPVKKGILDVVLRRQGFLASALDLIGKGPGTEQTPLLAAALFPHADLETDKHYVAYINQQPGVRAGVVLRPLPLDLTEALPVAQRPGDEVKAPFKAAERGTLRARDEAGNLIVVSVDGGPPVKEATVEPGEHTFSVANAGKETLVFSVELEPLRLQATAPLPQVPPGAIEGLPKFPTLMAAAPVFLDLENSERATFLVRAEKPALYSLETTGLLDTEGTVRTRTVISLDTQASNGVGRNFMIQQYLREGDYQLTVRPRGESAGHLGVRLSQTPITDGGLLTPSVPARVSLPAGQGVAYRFTIAIRGEYRLRTLGLGHQFKCRLEDGDGWPIERPNIGADITRTFEPGSYRLVLLPADVLTRRVTVLERVAEPLRFAGHGPHALPLDRQVEHVWEQPPEGDHTTRDVWEFSMPATVRVQVDLSAEMVGELAAVGGEGAGKIAELEAGRGWLGELKAASYRLSVACARDNNQVGYRIAVRPAQLVAGLTRPVSAPESVGVAVGRAGLVELSSFGSDDVRAVLVGPKGKVLAANDDRPDDWNFHVAVNLDPGSYTLRVLPVGARRGECLVSMRAPDEQLEAPLAVPGMRDVETGRAVHALPLQFPAGAQLLVASVRSAESVGCTLEAKSGSGWRALATRVGRDLRLEMPLAGLEAGAGKPDLRLRVWSVDQRGLQARVAAVAVTPPSVTEAALRSGIDLPAVAGSDPPVGAVRVALDRPGLFVLSAAETRASAGSGRAAAASAGEPVSAGGSALWLLGDLPTGSRAAVRGARVVVEPGGTFALRVPPGEPTVCDLGGEGLRTVLAIVSSMSGQPGVRVTDRSTAGGPAAHPVAMAVGRHGAAAVALGARQAAVSVWHAEPSLDALDVRLQQYAFTGRQPEAVPFGTVTGPVAAGRSLAYQLPAGPKRVRLALGEGVVAVLSSEAGVASVHWAGGPAFAESLDTSASRLTVLRAGADAGRFSVDVMPPVPGGAALDLSADHALEVQEPTAGIVRLALPVLDAPPDRPYTLHVRGASEAVLLAADGQVRRGLDLPLSSAGGSVLLSHPPGRLLCWLERPGGLGEAAWGLAESIAASPVELPAELALHGKAMTVRVKLGHPALLHLRTTTPVMTRLVRPEGDPEVEMYPNGCSLDAYLPAGAADLGLRSISGLDLSGSAEVTESEITAVDEGLGPEVLLPPGGTRGFAFTVTREGPVGVGVRADSDVVTCTLLDAAGRPIAAGVVQMTTLTPGRYVLALHAPAHSGPARARPAVVGIRPPDTGPPAEVVRTYLQLATGRQDVPIAAPADQEQASESEEPERSEPSDEPSGGDR